MYQSSTTWTLNNLCSHNTLAVFLQTARAVVQNPQDPHTSLKVRLLLDSSSQKSHLSERAQELLHLDIAGEQSLSIATFGCYKGSLKVCPIVNVDICMRGYPLMSLLLCIVPTICEPLVGQPIATCIERNTHLMRLELADFSSYESLTILPVDVLIGQAITGSW